MTGPERDLVVPFPHYALSNLSGCINRDRKRLARLERGHGELRS